MFFFEPEPYVGRVIFLATGHRGSKLRANPAVPMMIALIRSNNPLRDVWSELEVANGSFIFQPYLRNHAPSSADGLEADNALLTALDSQPIARGIAYHSIIANMHCNFTPTKITDSFVDYRSAHIAGAASERIITTTHFCEADHEVIDEVQRILHTHLFELSVISGAAR